MNAPADFLKSREWVAVPARIEEHTLAMGALFRHMIRTCFARNLQNYITTVHLPKNIPGILIAS